MKDYTVKITTTRVGVDLQLDIHCRVDVEETWILELAAKDRSELDRLLQSSSLEVEGAGMKLVDVKVTPTSFSESVDAWSRYVFEQPINILEIDESEEY